MSSVSKFPSKFLYKQTQKSSRNSRWEEISERCEQYDIHAIPNEKNNGGPPKPRQETDYSPIAQENERLEKYYKVGSGLLVRVLTFRLSKSFQRKNGQFFGTT